MTVVECKKEKQFFGYFINKSGLYAFHFMAYLILEVLLTLLLVSLTPKFLMIEHVIFKQKMPLWDQMYGVGFVAGILPAVLSAIALGRKSESAHTSSLPTTRNIAFGADVLLLVVFSLMLSITSLCTQLFLRGVTAAAYQSQIFIAVKLTTADCFLELAFSYLLLLAICGLTYSIFASAKTSQLGVWIGAIFALAAVGWIIGSFCMFISLERRNTPQLPDNRGKIAIMYSVFFLLSAISNAVTYKLTQKGDFVR